MYLPNTRDQITADHFSYDASTTITSGSNPQLVLPVMPSRASLIFSNLHASAVMYLGFGGATATATITSGKVTGISVVNAGFNYTIAPKVIFIGGGNTGWNMNNSTFLGNNQVNGASPANPATATCVMTGSPGALTVASITITNPGSGYAIAPKIFLQNDPNDPYGAFSPTATTPGSIIVPAASNLIFNGTTCPIDQLSVFCATSTAPFSCRYMP